MARFTIDEIITATDAVCLQNGAVTQVEFVGTDSRHVTAGMLFVPLKGERFDGHDYIEMAVREGAAAVLTDRPIRVEDKTVAVLQVADTRLALQRLAGYHRRRFGIDVVAVTGSNGKTTTKELIASVLAQQFRVRKTEKNYNNEIGMAMTLLQLEPADEICVVEMGMRGRGQIRELAQMAMPTIGVVTNVGVAHLELLGSRQEVALAKRELIEALPPNGTAVLNYDDERVRQMEQVVAGRTVRYGFDSGAVVQAMDAEYGIGKTKFVCRVFDEVYPVVLPMIGKHNVYNALAAIAVGRVLGISETKIQKGLQSATHVGMRQEIERYGDITFINDAYNANPDSLRSSLASLEQVGDGRKIAVLGNMYELGGAAAKAHREIGMHLTDYGIAAVITVGDLAAELADGAREVGIAATACATAEEAVRALHRTVRAGDIVLVKGSRSMQMEQLITAWKEGIH